VDLPEAYLDLDETTTSEFAPDFFIVVIESRVKIPVLTNTT